MQNNFGRLRLIITKTEASIQQDKMNSKSSSIISKSPLVYDGEHGLEEEHDGREEVDERSDSTDWCQCTKFCSMQTS